MEMAFRISRTRDERVALTRLAVHYAPGVVFHVQLVSRRSRIVGLFVEFEGGATLVAVLRKVQPAAAVLTILLLLLLLLLLFQKIHPFTLG